MLLTLALSRTIVRAYAAPHKSVTEALSCANNMIVAESGSAISGMFLTLFFARQNQKDGSILYTNAGHNLPLLWG